MAVRSLIESVLNVKKADLYLAFNHEASDELIKKLNDTLEEMKKDGTFDKLSAQ